MDNETTLEVILVNQNQKADETINALETIISQNENNKVDDILEAQLVTLDNIDKKIENTKLELEIDGAEVISIKGDTGEKGDKGDKGDTGANGKDGKDGVDGKDGADGKDGINGVDGISPNVDDITRDILETIVPKIPTAEELMSLVTMPKDGKDGKNGKNGKDGKDIDPKKIKDFEDNLSKIHSIASKTVSLVELDDVNLSGLTQTNGKYNLGSGGGGGAVDSVNGQTGVVVLGTADIADSSNKRYVTDAQLVVIGNTSGTNTGDNATNSQYSGLAASKQDTITGLTASGAELNILDGATLSTTELNYVDGVTSAIQTQIDTKAPTASPTFTGTTTVPALAMTGSITGGTFGTSAFLTGATPKRAVGSNLSTGNTDIYTCPTGKRAYIGNVVRAYNPSAGSITYFTQIKVSGTYYRIGASATLTTGTGGSSGAPSSVIVLEAGESLSINTATTSGLNVAYDVFEYSNTVPLYTSKILALSNGSNTLYTVPLGKSAVTMGSTGIALSTLSLTVCNNSGGSLNYIVYNVPSGGSAGSTNQLYPSTAIADDVATTFNVGPTLETGDFIVVNTSAGTATQTAWITVFEI